MIDDTKKHCSPLCWIYHCIGARMCRCLSVSVIKEKNVITVSFGLMVCKENATLVNSKNDKHDYQRKQKLLLLLQV